MSKVHVACLPVAQVDPDVQVLALEVLLVDVQLVGHHALTLG
jgi:hypothetical protein